MTMKIRTFNNIKNENLLKWKTVKNIEKKQSPNILI